MATFTILDDTVVNALADLNVQASTNHGTLEGAHKIGNTTLEVKGTITAVTSAPIFEFWAESQQRMPDHKSDSTSLIWTEVPDTRITINAPSAGDPFHVVSPLCPATYEDLRLNGSKTTLDGSDYCTMDAMITVN